MGSLVANPIGFTPTIAPGAVTIKTLPLTKLLVDESPIVIDTGNLFQGHSLQGAIVLPGVGMGGSFSDSTQKRLRRKMQELACSMSEPVVAVGWNSERFGGWNLALRLVALGYENVYWYRGGREAWEVAGLPETER